MEGHRQYGCLARRWYHRHAAARWHGARGGRRHRQKGSRLLASAELYDTSSGIWTATVNMHQARTYRRPRCCSTAPCWWRAATGAQTTTACCPRPSCTTREAGPEMPLAGRHRLAIHAAGAAIILILAITIVGCDSAKSAEAGSMSAGTEATAASVAPSSTGRPPPCPYRPGGGTCLGVLSAGTYSTTSFRPSMTYAVPDGGWATGKTGSGCSPCWLRVRALREWRPIRVTGSASSAMWRRGGRLRRRSGAWRRLGAGAD